MPLADDVRPGQALEQSCPLSHILVFSDRQGASFLLDATRRQTLDQVIVSSNRAN
jgi:hypothetical protein